jgi:hypothetical protein
MVMQRVTRRFIRHLRRCAVFGAAQGTEPAKGNAANAAGTATPAISVADRPTYLHRHFPSLNVATAIKAPASVIAR